MKIRPAPLTLHGLGATPTSNAPLLVFPGTTTSSGTVAASAGIDFSTWSNSDLDASYAGAYAAGDSQTQAAIGVEIIDREATVSGFIKALFGSSFPQFDAIQPKITGGFVATQAAQTAVATSASNVVTAIETAAKSIGGTSMLALIAAAVVALTVWKK